MTNNFSQLSAESAESRLAQVMFQEVVYEHDETQLPHLLYPAHFNHAIGCNCEACAFHRERMRDKERDYAPTNTENETESEE